MKLYLKFSLIVLLFLSLSSQVIAAIASPATVVTKETLKKKKKEKKESIFKQLTMEEIFTMPKADIEAKVGRKLKFKEKLGLKIVRKAAKKVKKKQVKEGTNENLFGILSISLGGLSFLSLLTLFGGNPGGIWIGIPFGIAAITLGIIGLKRKEPKKVLSVLGIIFGGVALVISLLIFLIILSFLLA